MRYEQPGSGVASTPILSVDGLRKRYGDQTVVDDLGFSVRRGQCFGLLGPNGAGKTTSLRMLLGMTTSPVCPTEVSDRFAWVGQPQRHTVTGVLQPTVES